MLTHLSPFLIGFCLCVPTTLEEEKTARQILDQAIEAMGGAKVLKDKALSGKSRGFIELQGNRSPLNNDWIVQGLDQFKWTSEIQLGDNLASIILILDRDKVWIKGNQADPNALPEEQVLPIQQGFLGLRIVENPLPLKDKGWKLSTLGELELDGQTAVGIKAVKEGIPEIDLYFDKKTHLPIRGEMRIVESDGRDVAYVATFEKYKKIAGRQFFTKLVLLREDKVVLEMERTEFKIHDSVDDDTFAKP